MNTVPIIKAERPTESWLASSMENNNMITFTEPRTKFGIVFAAVDRTFVPNCSAAILTNIAQYPEPVPNKKQSR